MQVVSASRRHSEASGGSLGAVLIAASLLVAACSGSTVSVTPTEQATQTFMSSPTDSPTATPDHQHPVGMIAIGHSGLTGEGAPEPHKAFPENSWATGTSPDVNSIYLRLTTVRPGFLGQVSNTARGGAKSSALVAQAT